METNEFDETLRALEVLAGKHQATELFNQEYEELLAKVKEQPLPRSGMLAKMKRILDRQLVFLTNRWLRENRKEGMN